MNNERIKILFVVQLPPPVHGSASISDILVKSPILKSTFDLQVLPLNYAKSMKDLGGISFTKAFKMFVVAGQLINSIRSFKPVAVYFTITPFGFGFYRDMLFVTILKLSRVKLVYHLHMKGVNEDSDKKILKRGLYKYVFKKAYVITLSKILSQDISRVYNGKPFVVNNGLPAVIKESSFKVSQKLNLDVLFLSNFMKAKGIFVFLNSIKILRDRGCRYQAHIVGAPGDVSIEEIQILIIRNDLGDRVFLHGPKYGSEKLDLLAKMDIFVHPTLNDAFPLVILEAMQFRLPIVSTYEGAIPEIVDNFITGFLVPKNDEIALADKIELLLNDKILRMEMGLASKKKFLAKYTSQQMEKNIADTLLEICTPKKESIK